tara:strand:- start:17314 stop:17646 length:333 start_codon:yes stop_codon:yes gene_type:complete
LTYYLLPEKGEDLLGEASARRILEDAMGRDAELVAIPLSRLHADMLNLSTRQLGLFLQKLITYGYRVAIVGDIEPFIDRSSSLRDFVYESNRGQHVWFVKDEAHLREKLG